MLVCYSFNSIPNHITLEQEFVRLDSVMLGILWGGHAQWQTSTSWHMQVPIRPLEKLSSENLEFQILVTGDKRGQALGSLAIYAFKKKNQWL